MTKPIEWKEPDKTVNVPGGMLRLDVRIRHEQGTNRSSTEWRPAIPADLVAALAAMGEGERGEVLERFVNYYGEPVEHLRAEKDRAWAAAEKAERERDALRVKTDGLRDCLEERKAICEDAIQRAIAAEAALAARPPREYPLAEGSRWEGDTIVDRDGVRQFIQSGIVTVGCDSGPTLVKVLCYPQNLAALLHARGLL